MNDKTKKNGEMKMENMQYEKVVDDLMIKDMKEKTCYIIDASYNGFCEYEMICMVGNKFYFFPCDEKYNPLLENFGMNVFSLNEMEKCFNEHQGDFAKDGITSVSTLNDLYQIEISLFISEKEHGYKSEYVSTEEFLKFILGGM